MELSSLKIQLATVGCMEKLRVESDISLIENKGVTLENLRHRFQLVIKNMQVWALYNVRVEVSGDLKPFVSLGVIESVPAENIFIGKTDDYYLEKSGVYPDVIRPLSTGDIILPPGGNRCLYVSVEPRGGFGGRTAFQIRRRAVAFHFDIHDSTDRVWIDLVVRRHEHGVFRVWDAEFDIEQHVCLVEIGIALTDERKRQDGGLTEDSGLDDVLLFFLVLLFFVVLRQGGGDVEESVAVEFPEDAWCTVFCLDADDGIVRGKAFRFQRELPVQEIVDGGPFEPFNRVADICETDVVEQRCRRAENFEIGERMEYLLAEPGGGLLT